MSSEIISSVGGVAAAMAIGAFIGQTRPGSIRGSDEVRRRNTALGGWIALALMTVLILYSFGAR